MKLSARTTSASVASIRSSYIRTRLAALDFILARLDYTFLKPNRIRFAISLGSSESTRNTSLPSAMLDLSESSSPTAISSIGFRCFLSPSPLPLWSPSRLSTLALGASIVSRPTSMLIFRFSANSRSLRFHYIATRDTFQDRARQAFLGLFDRHWNPDGPSGIVDYFCLQKKADAGQLRELSSADLVALGEGKTKFKPFGHRGPLPALAGRASAFRSSPEGIRDSAQASRVTFVFSPVNGQVALFERPSEQFGEISLEKCEQEDLSPEISLLASPKSNRVSSRGNNQMDKQSWDNRTQPKHEERRERPHRAAKSRPRSLRASGVTPASCCCKSQLVFWPRGEIQHTNHNNQK